jgi:thiosulfate/3-mercaptopyruvate sulfurtransferase
MRLNHLMTAAVLCLTVSCGQHSVRAQGAEPKTITVAELASTLKKPASERPLVIHVGFKVMFDQAHIPGSEHIGPGADSNGIAQLRKRVEPLRRDTLIVLYCGCCPWDHCPNVRPAAVLLTSMGFTNAKVVHFPDDFGTDWVAKGYPTQKGQ